nr:hypothetical protein [Citrobacter sp. FP75]
MGIFAPARFLILPAADVPDKSALQVAEAELAGVKSVPALVIDGNVLHINFGAPIEALK